jgi:trimethylamine--corrinoid protein Co-methyltransferase
MEKSMPLVSTLTSNLGATTPATLAGTLALLNAESLMGLVLSQLKNPGTPYILSCFTGVMDMSSGVCSWAVPEFSLMTAAYGDIARFYGLPNWGTAGCSDAKTLDQQAAIECTFSCLAQALRWPIRYIISLYNHFKRNPCLSGSAGSMNI